MNQEAWPTPTGGSSREPLPRIDDLPVAEQGYEQESVKAAFDSFYRHAAQLDAALRTLEAVDSFHRQAAALRADLRALRTAGWTQQPWNATPTYGYGYGVRAPREGISPALWRIAGEVAFLIVVAVLLGVAKLAWWVIVLVMAAAFLVVVAIEWMTSRDAFVVARERPVPAHPVVEAESASAEQIDEAVGWTAFEEAQEPSDAMTMIGAPPAEEAEPAVEAAVVEEAEAAAEPRESAEQEPDEADVSRRRWWRRREEHREEPEEAPDQVEIPRHVRVLQTDHQAAAGAADPWERGFDAEASDEQPAAADAMNEDTDESLSAAAGDAEQSGRRRFRRR